MSILTSLLNLKNKFILKLLSEDLHISFGSIWKNSFGLFKMLLEGHGNMKKQLINEHKSSNITQANLPIQFFLPLIIALLALVKMESLDFGIMDHKGNFIINLSLMALKQLAFNGCLFLRKIKVEWLQLVSQMVLFDSYSLIPKALHWLKHSKFTKLE